MAEAGRTRQGGATSARDVWVVVGPTASGKSKLALALARRLGGTVINADAMQCYRELRILTARPGPEDEAAAPHRLYGVRAATETVTAACWRQVALCEMAAATLPILCGGTGLYLSALVNGIADIPEPAPDARAEARALLAAIGPKALHARLDQETAARLRPSDSQRIARAYEVLVSTGRGLAAWQADGAAPLRGWRLRVIRLDPPREALRQAAAARFTAMLSAGALDEVRRLLALGLPGETPLLRALGVPELAAHLRGETSLGAAAEAAIAATLRYTRRQATWFRHRQLGDTSAMQIFASTDQAIEQLNFA